jgi:hypothetical protein
MAVRMPLKRSPSVGSLQSVNVSTHSVVSEGSAGQLWASWASKPAVRCPLVAAFREPGGALAITHGSAQPCVSGLSGAAQESNLPSLGLPDLTGFEDHAQWSVGSAVCREILFRGPVRAMVARLSKTHFGSSRSALRAREKNKWNARNHFRRT